MRERRIRTALFALLAAGIWALPMLGMAHAAPNPDAYRTRFAQVLVSDQDACVVTDIRISVVETNAAGSSGPAATMDFSVMQWDACLSFQPLYETILSSQPLTASDYTIASNMDHASLHTHVDVNETFSGQTIPYDIDLAWHSTRSNGDWAATVTGTVTSPTITKSFDGIEYLPYFAVPTAELGAQNGPRPAFAGRAACYMFGPINPPCKP